MATKKKQPRFCDDVLSQLNDARMTHTFNFQVFRSIFDTMSNDYKKSFEDSLTADELIDFSLDCQSVGYSYVTSSSVDVVV